MGKVAYSETTSTTIKNILNDANFTSKYWRVNASPEIQSWDMQTLPVGGVIDYDAKTQKYKEAKKGELVLGYMTGRKKRIIVSLFIVSQPAIGNVIYFQKILNVQSQFLTLAEIKNNQKTKEPFKCCNNTFIDISMDVFAEIISMMIQKGGITLADFQTAINSIPSLISGSASQSSPVSTSVQSSTHVTAKPYGETNFCEEVYGFDTNRFQVLKMLLETKKNIILQGAPGVGKTYAAKRLAYAMMGEKDDSRIEFVQFHQNYAYENFVMGYKPNDNGGFKLTEGIFYNFCKKAEKSNEPYFFIIDEINRGNLSKIFGELLMLIEKDYRGNDNKVKLAYRDELFSVPKNLYIIGMMNTADRSLAMIDYALRRRFSFYGMKPEFDSLISEKPFITPQDDKVLNVINAIKVLNGKILRSLGEGFCIGHSYFCKLKSPVNEIILKNIINFDIIPMLKEYWFDDTNTYEQESNKLLNALE